MGIEEALEKFNEKYNKELKELKDRLLGGVALILLKVKCISSDNYRYFLVVVFPPKDESEILPKVVIYFDDKCAYCGAHLTSTEGRVKCVICGEEFPEGTERVVCSEGHYICDKCYLEKTEKMLTIFCLECLVRHYQELKDYVKRAIEEGEYQDLDLTKRRAIAFRNAVYSVFDYYADKVEDYDIEVVLLTNLIIPHYGRIIADICLKLCEDKCQAVEDILRDIQKGVLG